MSNVLEMPLISGCSVDKCILRIQLFNGQVMKSWCVCVYVFMYMQQTDIFIISFILFD